MLKSYITVFCLIWFSGCRSGVKFNPDFYIPDHVSQTITSERGDSIPTNDPRFDNYACMNEEKIKELYRLLHGMKSLRSHDGTVSRYYQRYLFTKRKVRTYYVLR